MQDAIPLRRAVRGGTDVEPVLALHAAGIDLKQSGLRYFEYRHTPEEIGAIATPRGSGAGAVFAEYEIHST